MISQVLTFSTGGISCILMGRDRQLLWYTLSSLGVVFTLHGMLSIYDFLLGVFIAGFVSISFDNQAFNWGNVNYKTSLATILLCIGASYLTTLMLVIETGLYEYLMWQFIVAMSLLLWSRFPGPQIVAMLTFEILAYGYFFIFAGAPLIVFLAFVGVICFFIKYV